MLENRIMLENRKNTSRDTLRYVYGIRLFLKDGHIPMAELALGEGGRPTGETEIIEWCDMNARSKYHIDSYTYVWDEREWPANYTFNQYVHEQDIIKYRDMLARMNPEDLNFEYTTVLKNVVDMARSNDKHLSDMIDCLVFIRAAMESRGVDPSPIVEVV